MTARPETEPGDDRIRPWPLHPAPLPNESLTSWLSRTCEVYSLTNPAHLLTGFDIAAHELDRYTPEPILTALAERGAVPVERLRPMTLAGWTPWLLDSTDPAGCDFDTYVHQFSILLPADLAIEDQRRRTPTDDAWLPWVSAMGSRACPTCIDSLETTADITVCLLQQTSVLSSCLHHHCRLEPCFVLPGHAVFWDQVRFGSEERVPPVPVSAAVTELDRRTTAALRTGWVELRTGRVHAAVWFRLLRAVVDEVSTPLCRASRWATRLVAIWKAAGYSRPPRAARVPFEDLRGDEQAKVLGAAAAAITMIENGEIDGGGVDASLLRPRLYEPVDPGTAPTRSSYPVPERNAWAEVHAAAEEAIAAARVDPASARSLYDFLRWGCRTAQKLDETVQLFVDHGIPLHHPPT
ncbi:TniQ family protein [Rhodococcus sp. 14-2470-1a]|uniref:TniQ family protein n=1 Tax=Rhodococcus sp. 14-2470-1a TaxID=2023150 RepID=UPI000B9B67FB|nr:TniQ family protein [Rhodococcus sp. 14-2470-1a]OZF42067.1 transposase [Rhodococcus sp. 14-2470-1a]